MEFIIICLVAFGASALTLFSGFGLGTILTPVLVLFFPVPIAVAATAVVHFANNLFKLALVGATANKPIVFRFGLPAVAAAFLGAAFLNFVSDIPALASYTLGDRIHDITAVKLVIGFLIVFFALLEFIPIFSELSFDRKYLPFGGVLSGFFGGLSGNQGAFRSIFLVKSGLSKEEFIGTNIVLAVMVDIARIFVYGKSFSAPQSSFWDHYGWLVVAASVSAFLGAFLGNKMVKKVTLKTVQTIVTIMLFVLGLALATGVI